MVAPPTTPRSFAVDVARVSAAFQELARQMGAQFLDKQEIIRLMTVSAIAGEHMVIVGPPGTAKSAMIDMFAKLIDARYFEYLLTRFTEPNELFGPVDISAFREGRYTRRLEHMLPTAEIVFLDEIFKSNSAILNSLLHVINERKFQNGPEVVNVPLISLYAASNEVPNDDNLAAMFDRFLVRVLSDNLDSYHFHELMKKGISLELRKMTGRGLADPAQRVPTEIRPVISARELRAIQTNFDKFMQFPEEFLTKYKGLVFQIRSEGISVSDRRAPCSTAARASTTATSSCCATSGTTSIRSSCSKRSSTRSSTRTTASIPTSAGSSAHRRRWTIS
jgi:MoxR-like ATPase